MDRLSLLHHQRKATAPYSRCCRTPNTSALHPGLICDAATACQAVAQGSRRQTEPPMPDRVFISNIKAGVILKLKHERAGAYSVAQPASSSAQAKKSGDRRLDGRLITNCQLGLVFGTDLKDGVWKFVARSYGHGLLGYGVRRLVSGHESGRVVFVKIRAADADEGGFNYGLIVFTLGLRGAVVDAEFMDAVVAESSYGCDQKF
ncbi:hypothetical protein F4779DRAFT_262564 [Xylariaceae sp. FL0662B]|nr:hypothetical protein F4779DRAFT_262564 [Xylariaceae sp. FL0662B]